MRLPDPSTVRSVLLDAGGVLVHPNFDRVAAELRARGVAADAESLRVAEARTRRALDTPAGVEAAREDGRGWVYFNRLLKQAGIERSGATDAALAELKAWHDRHNLWESVSEDVEPALRRLRRGGLRLAVVSNANGTVRRLLERLGFLDVFAAVVDSAEEGVEKPDPRIFRIALERIGATPGETLHVGDVYHVDVVGARAAGIQAVLLDEARLHPEADCPRVGSLGELASHLVPKGQHGQDFLLDSETTR